MKIKLKRVLALMCVLFVIGIMGVTAASSLPVEFTYNYLSGTTQNVILLTKFEITNVEFNNSKYSPGVDVTYNAEWQGVQGSWYTSFDIECYDKSGKLIKTVKRVYLKEKNKIEDMPVDTASICIVPTISAASKVKGEYEYAGKKIDLYNEAGEKETVSEFQAAYYKASGWVEYSEVTLYNTSGEVKTVPMYSVNEFMKYGWYTQPVVVMYSNSGNSVVVAESEVEAYKAVGWFLEPAVNMYSLDGNCISVLRGDIEAYKGVGWYVEPVCMVYAPDGRQIVITQREFDSYLAVGWYSEPVTNVYAFGGKSAVVPTAALESYMAVGWSTEPIVTMYAYDGRTIEVFKSQVESYKAVGWFDYIPKITLYAPGNKTVNVAYWEAESYMAVGWYSEPFTTLYTMDGRKIEVLNSQVDAYRAVGWYTGDEYNYNYYKSLAIYDFHSIRNKYSSATAHGAYVYPFTNIDGQSCALVYVSYKIINNYSEWYLHNTTTGRRIEDPANYYDRLQGDYWGASKIHYMDLELEILTNQSKALTGFTNSLSSGTNAGTGVFVNASDLNR